MQHSIIKDITQATLSVDTIRPNMASCLAFCHKLILHRPKTQDLSLVFRSEELKESAQKVFPFSCHTEFSKSLVDEFNLFLQKRNELIAHTTITHDEIQKELVRTNSLLLTDWSASLFDGSIAPETDGFIDENGMPPWDTWLALIQVEGSLGIACLLSWVPVWLVNNVNSATKIDCSSSISWVVVQEKGTLKAIEKSREM